MPAFHMGPFSSSYYHPSDTVTPQHCCHKQQWGPKLPVINNVFVVNFCGTRFQSLGIQGNVLHFCSLHMVKCSTDLFYWINVWLMVKLIPKLLNVTQSNSNMEVVIHSVITEHTLCAKHSAKGLKVMKKYNTWFWTSIEKKITGDKGRKAGESQTNGHGFGVERKEKALKSGVVGGDCLQKVWNHQKLYLDLRRSEGGFQLRKGACTEV